jgi:hypothetical protein
VLVAIAYPFKEGGGGGGCVHHNAGLHMAHVGPQGNMSIDGPEVTRQESTLCSICTAHTGAGRKGLTHFI